MLGSNKDFSYKQYVLAFNIFSNVLSDISNVINFSLIQAEKNSCFTNNDTFWNFDEDALQRFIVFLIIILISNMLENFIFLLYKTTLHLYSKCGTDFP